MRNQFYTMKVPIFSGEEEAWGWLLQVEQYFKAKGIPETDKPSEARKAFTGQARSWYRYWIWYNPHASWWTFLKAFFKEFQPEVCLVDDPEFEPQEQQQKSVWEEAKIMEEEEEKRIGLMTEEIEDITAETIKKEGDEQDNKGSEKDKMAENVEVEETMAGEEENEEVEVERKLVTMVVDQPDRFFLKKMEIFELHSHGREKRLGTCEELKEDLIRANKELGHVPLSARIFNFRIKALAQIKENDFANKELGHVLFSAQILNSRIKDLAQFKGNDLFMPILCMEWAMDPLLHFFTQLQSLIFFICDEDSCGEHCMDQFHIVSIATGRVHDTALTDDGALFYWVSPYPDLRSQQPYAMCGRNMVSIYAEKMKGNDGKSWVQAIQVNNKLLASMLKKQSCLAYETKTEILENFNNRGLNCFNDLVGESSLQSSLNVTEKYCEYMIYTEELHNFLRWDPQEPWDPSGHNSVGGMYNSQQFKQWDPGKDYCYLNLTLRTR